jgi:Xaa-Pro aminopeptidase
MMTRSGDIRLTAIQLPDFGVPAKRPELSPGLYAQRFDRFRKRLREAGFTSAVVYADREHAANISYLTGFDPRFEEALMLVAEGHDPVILTGPENQGTAKRSAIAVDVKLYPPFGLLGQERSCTPALSELLRSAGIVEGARVGVSGWKYFGKQESPTPESWIEIPAFIVDTIRSIVGASGRVANATDILMQSSTGLRAINEIDQLAQFEFAASHSSEAIKRVLFGVRAGMTEFEAASLMRPIGLPLSCHPMLSAGERAYLGLLSPSDRVIERGDPFTTAFGLSGALTARAGFAVADASELAAGIRDYAERLAGPYFACAADWYETIGIGVTGGEIDALVKRRLGDKFFNIFLNPGHLIHLDEWMNTPVYPGSTERLQPGHAIQLDIIPATGSPYFTSNIEDGIALLDERGRKEFAERYPEAWNRIEARRGFMSDVLGIHLKPEVLPFSNLQGYLPPFILSPGRAFIRT